MKHGQRISIPLIYQDCSRPLSSMSYCELLMNLVLIFLTVAILFLFSRLSQNAQQLILLPGRIFEFHSHSQFSFVLIES